MGTVKKSRRGVLLILLMVWTVSLVFAVGQQEAESAPSVQLTRTIVDRNNRTVTVPVNVQRIVSLMSECTTAVLTLGAGDRLVGLDTNSLQYHPTQVALAGKDVALVGGSQEPSIEQILVLRPDIILYWGGFDKADEIQNKSGIPVVCLHSLTTMEGLEASYTLLGQILGLEQKTADLLKYAKQTMGSISNRHSSIQDVPKVHLLFWFIWNGDTRIPTFYDPVEIAGGKNVAKGLDATIYGYSIRVPVEQLVVWDPDFIFIHRNPPRPRVTVDTVLKDPRMQTVSAVRNQKVYYTLGMQNGWHYPRAIVETLYMAKLMHPNAYRTLDPRIEGDMVYKAFYGIEGLWTSQAENEGWLEYYEKLGLPSGK